MCIASVCTVDRTVAEGSLRQFILNQWDHREAARQAYGRARKSSTSSGDKMGPVVGVSRQPASGCLLSESQMRKSRFIRT